MRNKYPGICYRCGKIVKVGKGHFERYAGMFRVQHADCAIMFRGTDRHYKHNPDVEPLYDPDGSDIQK